MNTIDKTLEERGKRYGAFTGHAEVTQSIKDAMVQSRNWETLEDDMKEALEMVAHKIGRIVNGDPSYIDSWTDIVGYARLVEQRLIAGQDAVKGLLKENVFQFSDAIRAVTTEPIAPHTLDRAVPASTASTTSPGTEPPCDCAVCQLGAILKNVTAMRRTA